MEETTRPAVPCHRCEELTTYPVLVGFEEAATGPGHNINFCLPCACQRYKDHFQTCRDCKWGTLSCMVARDLRRSILARRLDRALDGAAAEITRRQEARKRSMN